MSADHPTVLLTGATGVVGRPLAERLAPERLVCLTHSAQLERPDATLVRGDLTRPRLGLARGEYAALAERVDVVVHAAAATRFDLRRDEILAVNVAGTQRVLEFAAASGARLVALSTAFVTADGAGGAGGLTARHYLDSKREAEDLVRGSTVPWHLVRPSVVVGRSGGASQGFDAFVRALLRDQLPVLPANANDAVDFVPAALLADVLAAIAADAPPWELSWVTAGPDAWTPRRALDATVAAAARHGVTVEAPRLLTPDMIERAVRPVIFPKLSRRVVRRYEQVAGLAPVVVARERFPSSLAALREHYGRGWSLDLDAALDETVARAVAALGRRRRAARLRAPAEVPA